jgi:tetratricopeptide (TPR) repeat protein
VAQGSVDRGKVRRGNRFYREGAYPEALLLYREALPGSTESQDGAEGVHYNLGNVFYRQGRWTEAIQEYRRAVGTKDSSLAGRVYGNLGNALVRAGRLEEALGAYLRALRYRPDDEDLLANLELVLRRLKKEPPMRSAARQGSEESGNRKEEEGREESSPPSVRNREGQRSGKGESAPDSTRRQQASRTGRERKERQGRPAGPDSQFVSAPRDTGGFRPMPVASTAAALDSLPKGMTRDQALRLLRALQEREAELQREKRKAAFVKRRKGKDW